MDLKLQDDAIESWFMVLCHDQYLDLGRFGLFDQRFLANHHHNA